MNFVCFRQVFLDVVIATAAVHNYGIMMCFADIPHILRPGIARTQQNRYADIDLQPSGAQAAGEGQHAFAVDGHNTNRRGHEAGARG